jgi:hypothetical protein
MHLFSNNATSTLSQSITDTDVTIAVLGGTGSLFPTVASPDFAYATLEKDTGVWEIVKITTHSAGADNFIVERGAEGSSSVGFVTGDRFEIRMTAGSIEQFLQRDGDTIDGGTY